MIHLEFESQKTRNTHAHKNYEMVYVLGGTCSLVVDGERLRLGKKEFILLNSGQKHSYEVDSDSLIGRFHIPYSQVSDESDPERTVIFALNCKREEKKDSLEKVQRILEQMMEYFCKGDKGARLAVNQWFFALMSVLLEHFAYEEKPKPQNAVDPEANQRICDIMDYINHHYHEGISLNELASRLYLTPAYLSKYIKQQFGISFKKLLVSTRLAHAESALLHTDEPIARIALQVGFSSLTSFNGSFRERHGMTPSQYRRGGRKSLLGLTSAQEEQPPALEEPKERTSGVLYDRILVEEDCQRQGELLRRTWNSTINIGTLEELLYSDVQSHILMLKQQLHFRYVRFWDLYAPGMYLDEHYEGKKYNFSRLDRVLDFLVENQLIPHIEVGNKPKILVREMGDVMMEPRKGDSPFKSKAVMRYFFSALMRHLMRRYGAAELDKWCMEFWMEEEASPVSLGWQEYSEEMIDRYLGQFEVLGETIRRFGTKMKLGGGGFSLRFGKERFAYAVRQWVKSPQRPDFLSVYIYPYMHSRDEASLNERVTRTDFLRSSICCVKQIMEQEHLKCRLAVTEWNITVFNRSLVNDSLFKGAWIIKNLIECMNLCDSMAYWAGTDLYVDHCDISGLLGGSCGLLTRGGLKKPAWYAFAFMEGLERRLCRRSENAVVTKGKYKDWSIVCHNFKPMNYAYYLRSENRITMDEIYSMQEDSRLLRLYFELPSLPDDEYRIKFLRVNRENGSLWEEWIRMSGPQQVDTEELDYLRNRCAPQMTISTLKEKNGKIAFTTVLEPNEIQMILLTCLGRN